MRVNGKEAFLHDADARTDERILELRQRHNWEGYGLYWALIEIMRAATEHKLNLDRTGALAFGLGVDESKLSAVIDTGLEVGLFEKEAGHFFSPSLRKRMEAYNSMCLRNKMNGALGGASGKRAVSEREAVALTQVNTREGGDRVGVQGKGKGGRVETIELAPRVRVTPEEKLNLEAEYGAEALAHYAPIASDWLIANGTTKKNYAAFLRNWIRKDIAECRGFYARKPGAISSAAERKADREREMLEKLKREQSQGSLLLPGAK